MVLVASIEYVLASYYLQVVDTLERQEVGRPACKKLGDGTLKAVFYGGVRLAVPLWDKGPVKVLSYVKLRHLYFIEFILIKTPTHPKEILDCVDDFSEFSQHAWGQTCFLRFQ